MNTPETDHLESNLGNAAHPVLSSFCRKLERERDEWKSKYIQQNKDLGCEMMDPNGTIWDHAKTLQRERDEAREQREFRGSLYVLQTERLKRIERERDEAREALAAEIKHHTETTAKWNGHHMDLTITQCDLNKAIRELAEARAEMAAIKAMLLDPVEVELDMIRGNIAIPERPEFSGVYDTGKAMANLIRERDEARGQRDRLAADLQKVVTAWDLAEWLDENDFKAFREALQSLTPEEKP